MTHFKEPLLSYLKEDVQTGTEISITGKWISTQKSKFFRKSSEYKEMLKEWDDIHQEAKQHEGMLSTEINPAIGQDAVLSPHFSGHRRIGQLF